tara:strand:- start:316 stop:594 length:279 start_codon:yes stop_codon:yes gene_type:complete
MLHEIELENGYMVQVDYEYEASELDYHGTGYQGGVTINALWVNLTDANGKLLKVDILHFMQGFEEFDKDELEGIIQENYENHEPDPDRYRDE